MVFEGMPDFQESIREKDVCLFAPFGGRGGYTLLPRGLDIATRDDGTADFHLGIVRPENPMLPPAPYGTLDFRLQAAFDMEAGLALLRAHQPGAVLKPALFRDGFAQVSLAGDDVAAAQQFVAPVPINFQGLGVTRFFAHLDVNVALLVKGMLQQSTAGLRATAHLELWGVAPRLPLQVRLDPAPFLQHLRSKADAGGLISPPALVSAFLAGTSDMPWKVEGNVDQVGPALFSQCMADHVRARFASLAPPLAGQATPLLLLPPADQFGSGTFLWDLNEPTSTARVVSLNFDPLPAARALVSAQGIDAVVSMDTVRKLQTGVVSIAVSANLPAQRQGVPSLGATVKVPLKMPFRPQQINRTLELEEPHDSASVQVQLSPKEALAYTYQTFVILQDPAGIHRLEGNETPHAGEKLYLNIDDFPVSFVQVDASDRLFKLGTVSATLRVADVQNPFALSAAQPRLSLAVPKDAAASLELELRSPDGAHVLKLEVDPAHTSHFDLTSFREYGPQTLDIQCAFHGDAPLLAIDLLPEASEDAPGNISVLAMTPAKPQQQWKWFASSPFAPGYRYRVHDTGSAWSEVRSPFEPLLVDSAVLSQAAVAGGHS